jgi:prepilin-type N-terminal cleavage/methylation domain-containing protein
MNRKGFTLIELLATIALLAIISIVSFVSIGAIVKQSRVNDCESLVLNIKSAAKEYISDNRYLPAADSWENIVNITAKTLIDGHYLSGPIYNPFDNNEELSSSNISVSITLDDNYTVKNVQVTNPNFLETCQFG